MVTVPVQAGTQAAFGTLFVPSAGRWNPAYAGMTAVALLQARSATRRLAHPGSFQSQRLPRMRAAR
jgi:hypothetical protein